MDFIKFPMPRPTIDGKMPAHVDPIVLKLVNGLEKHSEDAEGLETEAKLGMVCEESSKKGAKKKRLRLPLETEVVLAPKCGDCNYQFEAGVKQDQFHKIKQLLTKMHDKPTATRFQIQSVTTTKTVDEMYNLDGNRVRISYRAFDDMRKTNEVVEKMCKCGLEDINVWSGPPDETGGGCSHRDFRISFRDEQAWVGEPPSKEKHTMVRRKDRKTYHFNGWKVDCTVVDVEPKGSERRVAGTTKRYEVEFELKSELIMTHFRLLKAGKDHMLYSILSDFTWFVRDIAWLFSSNIDTNAEIVDLSLNRHTLMPHVENFRNRVSPVLPIIGHYLLECANEVETTGGDNPDAKKLAPQDSNDSDLMNLHQKLQASNKQNSWNDDDPTPKIGVSAAVDDDDDDEATPRIGSDGKKSAATLFPPGAGDSDQSDDGPKKPNLIPGARSPSIEPQLDPNLPVFEMDLDPPPFAASKSREPSSDDEAVPPFRGGETPSSQNLDGMSDHINTPATKRQRR